MRPFVVTLQGLVLVLMAISMIVVPWKVDRETEIGYAKAHLTEIHYSPAWESPGMERPTRYKVGDADIYFPTLVLTWGLLGGVGVGLEVSRRRLNH